MRTKNILIKLSETEKDNLLNEAHKSGLSMTAIVRLRISDIIRPGREQLEDEAKKQAVYQQAMENYKSKS